MDANTVLLVTVVATALAFDFTNGFHKLGECDGNIDRHWSAATEDRGGDLGKS